MAWVTASMSRPVDSVPVSAKRRFSQALIDCNPSSAECGGSQCVISTDEIQAHTDTLFGRERSRLGLYEALSTCRAIRRLRPDPIPDEVLERVLRAATFAPTGGNAQPWRVIVVRDPERKRAIAEHFDYAWQVYSTPARERMAQLPQASRARGMRVLAAGDHLAAHFAEVPVVLAWIHDPAGLRHPDELWTQPHFIYGGSLYPAIHNLLLACRAEGLGGVLTTMTWRREPELCALLDVPEPWRMHALVPIGYPLGGGHGALARRPLAKMVFAERFGATFQR